MNIRAAIILAAGNRVAVVAVDPDLFENEDALERIRVQSKIAFRITRIVFVTIEETGISPGITGNRDEVQLLANIDLEHLPWGDYEI